MSSTWSLQVPQQHDELLTSPVLAAFRSLLQKSKTYMQSLVVFPVSFDSCPAFPAECWQPEVKEVRVGKSDTVLETVMKLKLCRRLLCSFWLGRFTLDKAVVFLNILIWSNEAQLQIGWGRAKGSK